MRPVSKACRLTWLLIYVLLTATSATYIPWNRPGPVADVSSIPEEKSNSNDVERRRLKPLFRNDAVSLIASFVPLESNLQHNIKYQPHIPDLAYRYMYITDSNAGECLLSLTIARHATQRAAVMETGF